MENDQLMGKSTISMAISNSYVSFPEGIPKYTLIFGSYMSESYEGGHWWLTLRFFFVPDSWSRGGGRCGSIAPNIDLGSDGDDQEATVTLWSTQKKTWKNQPFDWTMNYFYGHVPARKL